MSKTETKPVQKPILPALFRSAKEKLPFPYHHETMIYRKLWKINFRQEKAYFVQTLGVSIICLVLLSFRGDLVQGVSVAIAIFLFNKMSTSYFQAGFKDRLLHAIPWDMKAIKKSLPTTHDSVHGLDHGSTCDPVSYNRALKYLGVFTAVTLWYFIICIVGVEASYNCEKK